MGIVLLACLEASSAAGLARGKDHVNPETHEVRRELRKQVRDPVVPSVLDRDVLTVDVTQRAQSLEERRDIRT